MAEIMQRVSEVKLGGIKLKKEQELAVIALLEKKDVFAVLPTGFGVKNGIDRPTRLLRFVTFVHLPFSFRSLDLFVASLLL